MKIKRFVRQSLFFAAFFLVPFCYDAFNASAEILPDIEAHQARIVPVEKSKTGRVYRFKMDADSLPKTGNIIVVSLDKKLIMAFRVLKTDVGTGELIGKRVRRYDAVGELKLDEPYTSAEKIADLVAPPPPEAGQYRPDAGPELDPDSSKSLAKITNKPRDFDPNAKPELDSHPAPSGQDASASPLMGGSTNTSKDTAPTHTSSGMDVEKFDEELDGGTSPQNIKVPKRARPVESTDDEIPDQLMEGKSALEIEERVIIHPYVNAIGFQVGAMKNMSGFSLASTTNTGFIGTYGRTLRRNVFLDRSSTQDSVGLEAGFGYYTRSNFTNNNDDYTILPLKFEMHYNLHFSEAITLFGYLGLQYNYLMGTDNVDTNKKVQAEAVDALSGPQQVLGVGMLYNMGPQWYLRADLGWDRMAFGLTVKW